MSDSKEDDANPEVKPRCTYNIAYFYFSVNHQSKHPYTS